MMDVEEISLGAEVSGSEDEGDDERKHNQLVDAISSLDGKNRHKLSQRTVLTNQISEFNFATSGEGGSKVRLHELLGTLKDTAKLGNLKKQLNVVNKRRKVVAVPLPKHEKQKIDRTVAYDNTKKDVSKWDTVVEKNRLAEQLQFPLNKPDLRLATTDDFVKRFQMRTPLEMQVAAMLQGSENVIQDKGQELTPAEQRALRAMDIQEARERHAELMKYKALLSYQEAKARWRNKIKSKRYHRMLKKDRLKQEKKDLDKLEKTDPEGYTEKLKQLERDRVAERMSLKHRGGSKYARKQMIYAKYDDRAREQVQDMLQKSREITKKIDVDSDSEAESEGGVSVDSADETRMVESQLHSEREDNPWMKKVRRTKKDNPWMAKLGATTGSVYSRPEAFKDKSVKVEEESAREIVGDTLSEDIKLDQVKAITTTDDSGVELNLSCKDKFNSEPLSFVDSKKKKKRKTESNEDEIEKIFSKTSKSKKVEDMNKRKVKKKNKNKQKEKSTAEKVNNTKETTGKNKIPIDSDKEKDKAGSEKMGENSDEEEEMINEGLSRKRTLEEIEDIGSEIEVDEPKKVRKDGEEKEKGDTDDKSNEKEAYVDPTKLFTLDSKLKQVGAGPDLVGNDDDDLDPEEQQRMTIAQAFADDDVIEEFRRDKGADIDKNKPKDLDLTLPGWGEWGGAGIKISKRKKKRFIIKAPPAPPRQDSHLGNVIINEQKVNTVSKHQVNQLPYPFVSVEQFEKSIRAPLGKTWNPETAHQELVKPKVVTKLGKIITPIDKSEVYRKTKKSGSKSDMRFHESQKEDKSKQLKDKMSKKPKKTTVVN